MSQQPPKEEKLDARGLRVAICHTRWNSEIVDRIVAAAAGELEACGAALEPVRHVAGVFELAPLVARVARKGSVDGIIAIGCLIRGETDHYTLLANETTRALGALSLELGTNPSPIALTFGVLACNTEQQARARIEHGRDFARTCIAQILALRAVE